MARLKTTDEYKAEVKETYPNIDVLGEYKGGRKKILHKCILCGHKREVTPNSLFQTKYGCPKCAHITNGQKQMRTHEQFILELKEINPKIEILSEYQGNNEKISCRCLVDGYQWNTTPSKLINAKHGCPKCGGSLKISNEEFLRRVEIVNPNITMLESYVNDSAKILASCNCCKHQWKISPSHIYSGRGCPKCAQAKKRDAFAKSQEKFESELSIVNPNIEVIGEYTNSNTKIQCKCKICGKTWSALPTNLLKGKGCPRCAASNGEKNIEKWLLRNSIKYIAEATFDDCRFKHKLPFDFYLPDLNICIEYDGYQHFYPVRYKGMTSFDADAAFAMQKERDEIKNNYCKNNNIHLIRIPYWRYSNIPDILEKHIS